MNDQYKLQATGHRPASVLPVPFRPSNPPLGSDHPVRPNGVGRSYDGGNSQMAKTKKRIGVLVVAYNAASTLAKTLDRIPDEVRGDIEEVVVSDDHSQDSTYLVGLGYQQTSDLPINLIRQPKNLGYGGNQKAGYNLAIEHGLDIVVMLHGDGQYAPESMPDLIAPLISGEADAVFGSRIMIKGAARKGGMQESDCPSPRSPADIEQAVER